MTDSDRRPVAVSDLARLARCEQQQLLDFRFGKRRPAERERLAVAGEAEHARHDALARRYQGGMPAPDRRCFVASAVYGESARETGALRAWRDRALRPTRHGRAAIGLYYVLSPPLARWLARHPRGRRAARWVAGRIIHRRSAGHATRRPRIGNPQRQP